MMKNLILTLIAFFLFIQYSFAQITYINTQQMVDNFISTEKINAEILIFYTDQNQDSTTIIRDLSGLQNVDTIIGAVTFTNLGITDLNGLEGLKYVDGNITVASNPELIDISALGQNPILFDGSIDIKNNPKLENLPKFDNLSANSSFEGITIENCNSLSELNLELPVTNNSTFSLTIWNNKELKSVSYQGSVDDLSIYKNSNLEMVHAEVTSNKLEDIWIDTNATLSSLTGFSSYDSLSYLHITANPQLSNLCALQKILERGNDIIDYVFAMGGNGSGANSEEELLAQDCSNWSNITEKYALVKGVYPNPTHGILNIQDLQQSTPYRLINLQGQLVQHGMAQPKQPLHLEQLPSCIYFLELEGEKPVKVVKQ